MESQRIERLSVLFILTMLAFSFSFGFHNYSKAEKAIIADLNQALQQTILINSSQWINKDTLQTYSRLSSLFGNPVSIKSYNKDFYKALSLPLQEENTGIVMHVVNKKKKESPSVDRNRESSENYLASDTVIWMSTLTDIPSLAASEIGVSFQGYANCSTSVIFSMTDKTLPVLFLVIALLSSGFVIYLRRSVKKEEPENTNNSIVFGNLVLSCDKASFYKDDQEKLKLTPQQYTLMEMFFLSPVHMLTRTEICDALWPGKVNADETLNTLTRRLRPLIEENTNLKITTDRGRAYETAQKHKVAQEHSLTY